MTEKLGTSESIIHVDMDCFFAAVEVKDNPELAGKPVIVGADPRGRGVVSTASYEARHYGVHSAMPISRAYQLCPHGVFLPVNGERYHEESEKIVAIFHQYTPLVEILSLDEAFLDVSGSTRLFGDAVKIAHEIKDRIKTEQGLVASVGVAPTKFIAKIASDIDKPDGFVVVRKEEVQEFLNPLPIDKMWGVGRVTEKSLLRMGILTIGDLARIPEDILERKFGKAGVQLHRLAHGIDPRRVTPDEPAKSIGHETTFPEDVKDRDILEKTLLILSEKVGRRLRRHSLAGQVITLKLRYENFQTITRRRSLDRPIRTDTEVYSTALSLLGKAVSPSRKVRLIGVSVSGFTDSGHQEELFGRESERRDKVQAALDELRKRFGDNVITRARLK